jgi:hypothetical protein
MPTIELSELPPEVAARVRVGAVFTDHGEPVAHLTKAGPILTPEALSDLLRAFDDGASLAELARAHSLRRFELVNALAAAGRDPYRYEADQLAWEDGGSAAVLAAARERMAHG